MIIEDIEVKDIPGFSNYAISRDGMVWSKLHVDFMGRSHGGKWLKPRLDHNGYLYIRLSVNGIIYTRPIHLLVIETYKGPRPEGKECRHLDGNPKNCYSENLEWGTKTENQLDSVRHGTNRFLILDCRGKRSGMAKLTDAKVRVMRYLRDVAKFSLRDLAWQFDVGITTVSSVCRRETWKHI